MRVTVTNLSQNPLSTDVGLLNPGESKSLDMGPQAAYRAAESLKTLVDAGKASVTVAEESRLLDAAEPASLGTPVSLADGSVTTAKLAALAVDSTKLAAGAVTTAKLGALAVDSAALAASAVTAGKIATGGVSAAGQFAAGVVDAAALAASAVTAAKAKVFASAEQTGTGSSQNVAHGLSATPSLVMVAVTEDPAGTGFDVAEGAHDGTNVVVTVTSGVKFKVLAWA